MSPQATARAPEALAAAEPRSLEFYRTRDDIMRAYAPQTDEERLLALQIARAWYRLQKFYDLEATYLEQGLTDLFSNDIEKYKTLCRTVAEAERAWRHAATMFERARARSKKSTPVTRSANSCTVSFSSRGTSVPPKVTNNTTPIRTSSSPQSP